jgi:hypothetical protein
MKRGYEYYDAHGLLNTYTTNTADTHAHSYYSKSVVTVEVLHFFRPSSHSPSMWSVTCNKELRSKKKGKVHPCTGIEAPYSP